MKKIIISLIAIIALAALAAISPFQASLALADDGVFTGPGGAVDPGLRDPYDGDHFDDYCDNDICLDPCEWGDCGCEWYGGCDDDILCDWGCPNPCDTGCDDYDPCDYSSCYPQHDNSEYIDNENTNTNENNNTNINRNEVYITIYGQGSISGSDINVRSLPSCNNGVDDDNDGRVDFNDSDCKVYGKENGQNARLNTAAPVFVSVAPTNAREGVLYVYDADARDNDDDSLSYTLIQNPAGMTIESRDGLIRWTPTSAQAGVAHSVTVSVSDGSRQTMQNFQVFVDRAVRVAAQPVEGRVAGASKVVKVAEAAERNTLHAYNIRVDTDEDHNSVISWDTTEPSRGRVMYGLATRGDSRGTDFTGANQYEFNSPDSPEISTSHRVVLGQLENERVYYFRVMSFAGTQTDVSSERSFVQLGSGETLISDAGFASVIGTLGAFIISPWFLLLVVILLVLLICFRRRDREIVAHAPVEVKVGGGHH